MAEPKKVSELAEASTPLTGTELLKLVQSDASVRATVAQLLADTVTLDGEETLENKTLAGNTKFGSSPMLRHTLASGAVTLEGRWWGEISGDSNVQGRLERFSLGQFDVARNFHTLNGESTSLPLEGGGIQSVTLGADASVGITVSSANNPENRLPLRAIYTLYQIRPNGHNLTLNNVTWLHEDVPNFSQVTDSNRVLVLVLRQSDGTNMAQVVSGLAQGGGATTIDTKTSAYSLQGSDAGKIIECDGTFTVTLSDGLADGAQFVIVNIGTGTITLAPDTGSLSAKGTKLADQWGAATVYHKSGNDFRAFGDLSS